MGLLLVSMGTNQQAEADTRWLWDGSRNQLSRHVGGQLVGQACSSVVYRSLGSIVEIGLLHLHMRLGRDSFRAYGCGLSIYSSVDWEAERVRSRFAAAATASWSTSCQCDAGERAIMAEITCLQLEGKYFIQRKHFPMAQVCRTDGSTRVVLNRRECCGWKLNVVPVIAALDDELEYGKLARTTSPDSAANSDVCAGVMTARRRHGHRYRGLLDKGKVASGQQRVASMVPTFFFVLFATAV
jgi:hypothetical protein